VTPRELLALPLVECPRGGGDCCASLYFNRPLCSYPVECHLDIIMRMMEQTRRDRKRHGDDLDMMAGLGRATVRIG
jgi:hypothetical protein